MELDILYAKSSAGDLNESNLFVEFLLWKNPVLGAERQKNTDWIKCLLSGAHNISLGVRTA